MWPLITSLLVVRVKNQARRYALSLAFYIAAALSAAIAVGFLLAALWIILRKSFGPLGANLWFAGGFIVLAMLVLLVRELIFAREVAKAKTVDQRIASEATALKTSLRPKKMLPILGVATVLGVVLGQRFKRK